MSPTAHTWDFTSISCSCPAKERPPIKLVSTVKSVADQALSEIRRQSETPLILEKRRNPSARKRANIAIIGQVGSGAMSAHTLTPVTDLESKPATPKRRQTLECADGRKMIKKRSNGFAT